MSVNDGIQWEHKPKKCSICNSPNLRYIEIDYMNWLDKDEMLERHPEIHWPDMFAHCEESGWNTKKLRDKKKMLYAIISKGLDLMERIAKHKPEDVLKMIPKAVQLLAEMDGDINRGINVKADNHYHITQDKREERLRIGMERFRVIDKSPDDGN